MPILVTGATGFVGGYVIEALLAQGERSVLGLGRGSSWPMALAELAEKVPVVDCDLCDGNHVEKVLREACPETIFHLAGYAWVGRSFAEPDAARRGNLTATRSLYDAVVRWGGRPRIVYVGSGQVYGEGGAENTTLDEETPLRPTSPYASSKAAADLASYQYSRAPGLDIVRARPFNHIGPRQSVDYAIPHFARQIAAIARGDGPAVIETGNLQSRRDLSDVRDVVEAYLLLAKKGRCGEAYNIASGRTWSMHEVLQQLLAVAGIKVEIRQRPDLVRPVDLPAPAIDIAKLRRDTGWAPRYALERTLKDTLEYWRKMEPQ